MNKLACLALGVLISGGAATAAERATTQGAAVDRLEPGQWLQVPNSHLVKVAFDWPAGVKHGWGVAAVMSAWSGGAYDSTRDRLVIWGGGHGDYAGNELYVFDVKELKWQRVNNPTTQTDPEGKLERTGVYADGNPRSCHTYDYVEYVSGIDRFCSFGVGATWPFAWSQNPETLVTWAFDFDARKWERKSHVPFRVHASAWDPVAGRIWVRSRFAAFVAAWDPAKDAWATRSRHLPGDGNFWVSGVVDPVRRRFLTLGGGYFWAYNIGGDGLVSQEDIKSTGPQDIVTARMGPAVEYDPVLDRLVGWNGGADVYTMDLTKLAWEKFAPAAGNVVVPTPPCKNGTWGRWRYIPSKNAYILVNGVDQNVYVYRLTRREDQPIPERFAEALKKPDAALVRWVAGEVAKWPRAKAEPVLKAAVAAQAEPGHAEIARILQEALKTLK